VQDYLVAQKIDHTLLKPDATQVQIVKLCNEAKEHKFFGVCINSCWLPLAKQELSGSSVAAVCVIGFPLGAMSTAAKCSEAHWCAENGAQEVDMVINIGQLKDKNYSFVQKDIAEVVKASGHSKTKVIIETSLLAHDEKVAACKISAEAGAHFVKTSTGFNGGGATIEDIVLMRRIVGKDIGVKASGGIKNLEQAMALINAGANRLGTSSGIAIVSGKTATGGY
jgi:deoxyribose-phosphate aldolase